MVAEGKGRDGGEGGVARARVEVATVGAFVARRGQ